MSCVYGTNKIHKNYIYFMKKFIYLTAAALTTLAAASCSQDDAPVPVDEGMTVFSVKLPQDMGSRAFGDTVGNQQLNVAIYAQGDSKTPLFTSINGVQSEGITVEQFADNGLTATVKVPLVKNKAYDLVFWSQDKTDQPYKYNTDGQTLEVTYGTTENPGVNNFEEKRDAFFASKTVTSGDAANSQTIQLRRMFAQVNVGTADLPAYIAAGGDNNFGITISGVANTINLMTGIVENPTSTITATTSVKPASVTSFPEINGYTGKQLRYLGMAYVLVGDNSKENKSTVNVTLNANGNPQFATYNSVPVQMNFRTNIYGDLLTNPEVFNVTIDPIFAGYFKGDVPMSPVTPVTETVDGTPTQVYYANNEANLNWLMDGINNGTLTEPYIKLGSDLDFSAVKFNPASSEFSGTLDGGDNVIRNLTINGASASGKRTRSGEPHYGLFNDLKNATVKNLKFENVNISAPAGYVGAVAGYATGSIIEDVEVISGKISTSQGAGGIVGFAAYTGTIRNCVNRAAITADWQAGGIAGFAEFTDASTTPENNITISGCTNYGTVSGSAGYKAGIVAESSANIENCTNYGEITANRDAAAGIVADQRMYGYVKNCINHAKVTGQTAVGGIVAWIRYWDEEWGRNNGYTKFQVIDVTGNTNWGSLAGTSCVGGIVGRISQNANVSGNFNYAQAIAATGAQGQAAGILGGWVNDSALCPGVSPATLVISNNSSSTPLASITTNNNTSALFTQVKTGDVLSAARPCTATVENNTEVTRPAE